MTHVGADGTRKTVAVGYSGIGDGLDNPAAQSEENVGPIPTGNWTIGPQADHHETGGRTLWGAMRLTPALGNSTQRTQFYIHGDNAKGNHSASDGCVVLPKTARDVIARSGVKSLKVVP